MRRWLRSGALRSRRGAVAPVPSVTIERHPPERGPQGVVLPSACCTCCCCCSCCCLTSVGAVVGGVIAVKGAGDERARVRGRIGGLLWLTVLPTVVADAVFTLPLVVTLVLLPLSMLGAGILAWFLYKVGIYKDPERLERALVRRYLGYATIGTIVGLVAMLPLLAFLR